jgi:hypothetical protein
MYRGPEGGYTTRYSSSHLTGYRKDLDPGFIGGFPITLRGSASHPALWTHDPSGPAPGGHDFVQPRDVGTQKEMRMLREGCYVPPTIAVGPERNSLRGTRFIDQTVGAEWPWRYRQCPVDGWATAARKSCEPRNLSIPLPHGLALADECTMSRGMRQCEESFRAERERQLERATARVFGNMSKWCPDRLGGHGGQN